MERARELLKKTQCPNGNCTQVKCLLHHSKPPVVIKKVQERKQQGILNCMEKDKKELCNQEDEEMMVAIAESLLIARTCPSTETSERGCSNCIKLEIVVQWEWKKQAV